MSNLYRLTEAQIESLKPFFPKSYGKPRIYIFRNASDSLTLLNVGLRLNLSRTSSSA